MGVFEHFPYVNFHELNLSWIVNKLKELEDAISQQVVDLVARAGVAANAQAISNLSTTVTNNATTAHNEALAAQNTANNAVNTANSASSTATTASNTASAASTAAATAQAGVDAIGTKSTLVDNTVPVPATLGYTGVSFTVLKKSIVRAALYYTNSSPQEILITDTASGNINVYAETVAPTNHGTANIYISCESVLDPGTYYIWARSTSAANNEIKVIGYQIVK